VVEEDRREEMTEEEEEEVVDEDVTGLNKRHALTLLTQEFFIFRKYLENLPFKSLAMRVYLRVTNT
jgi:hypothetical protein